jgi:hypothetical protein
MYDEDYLTGDMVDILKTGSLSKTPDEWYNIVSL